MAAALLDPILLPALLLPLALALLARHRALHAPDALEARWFAFARRMAPLRMLSAIGWLLAVLHRLTHPSHLTAWLFAVRGPEVVTVFLVLLTPIALLPAVLGLVAHDVARRLGTTDFGRREVLGRAAWLVAAAVLPAIALGLGALAIGARQPLAGTALFGAAAVLALFALGRARRGLVLTPHSVTQGELRDRLFVIARRAGVEIRQLYVLPMKRLRMANAFAVHGQVVMVTDLLLERLTRAEVDAVLAHEIAHLRRGDPLRLMLVRAGSVLAPIAIAWSFGWSWAALPMVAGLLASSAFSRRIERATDLAALRLGADPRALVAGLVKLARLSHVPIRWSRWTGAFLTHPSVEQRARYLAAAGGIGAAELAALLAGATAGADHYAPPAGIENGGRLFSTRFKHAVLGRNTLLLLAVVALVPAALFAEAAWLAPGAHLRLPMTLLALLLTPAAALVAGSFLAVEPLRALRRPLAARVGLGASAREWTLAGLAPHAGPRVYEGFSNWELGFVRVGPDALEFAGEEARFALRRESVASVELAPGPPTWIRVHVVRIGWRDGSGVVRFLRLSPFERPGVHAIAGQSRRLVAEIERWLARGEAATPDASAIAAGSPPAGEVTSTSPRAVAPPGMLVPLFAFDLAFSLVFSLLFRLPLLPVAAAGWLDVALIAFATQVFLMIPTWRSRESAPAPSDRAERERLAA